MSGTMVAQGGDAAAAAAARTAARQDASARARGRDATRVITGGGSSASRLASRAAGERVATRAMTNTSDSWGTRLADAFRGGDRESGRPRAPVSVREAASQRESATRSAEQR